MEFDWQLPVFTLLDSIIMHPVETTVFRAASVPRVPKDCALPDGGGRDWAKLLRRFSSCLHAACLAVERGRVGRVTPSPVLSPSRCVLRSQGGEVKKDITDEECQGGCVQARPECSSRAFHLKMLEISRN